MKKILVVTGLLVLCGFLEVPQDYEWTPDMMSELHAEQAGKSTLRAGHEESTRIPESVAL